MSGIALENEDLKMYDSLCEQIAKLAIEIMSQSEFSESENEQDFLLETKKAS